MGKWGLLFLLPSFCIGCTQDKSVEPLSWQITFLPLGAKVQIANQAPIKRITAFNSNGNKVAQLDFPVQPRQIESLYFEWQAGETYKFEATLSSGEVVVQTVSAPLEHVRGNFEIAIPYGAVMNSDTQSSKDNTQQALLLQGSVMTATVVVTNGNVPTTFDIELCIPSSLTINRLSSDWVSETTNEQICLSTIGEFKVASEVWHRELEIDVTHSPANPTNTPEIQSISGIVRWTSADRETWEQQATVQLRIETIPEIERHISIASIDMPTDETGIADLRLREDTIYHPRPLFSWLSTEQTDEYAPTTYQAVHINNQGEETIHVVISSINRDVKTGEVVPFLAPPDAVNAGTDRSISFASLPAGKVSSIPLPIFFHPQFAVEGEYEREISVKIWGSDSTVLSAKRPLNIVVPNRHALFVSGLAILASCTGLIVLLRYHRQFFVRFSTKQLIVIALFGTTIFVAVVVPSTLFLNLIRVILGPVSVLLTGLVNETLYYALLTALLIYIYGAPGDKSKQDFNGSHTDRKGGVILLVSAVRLLLGAVTFGLFTPMTIIYTGTSILLLETGFLLVRKRGLLVWALVLGICDAIAVYVDFQLSILFYRLFYADWYIWLRIFVEGFAYTFIGVLLGARLGRGLWRVAD